MRFTATETNEKKTNTDSTPKTAEFIAYNEALRGFMNPSVVTLYWPVTRHTHRQ